MLKYLGKFLGRTHVLMAYVCHDCGAVFNTRFALGGHRSVLACTPLDKVIRTPYLPGGATPNLPPAAVPPPIPAPDVHAAAAAAAVPAPVHRAPAVPAPMDFYQLLMRPTQDVAKNLVQEVDYAPVNAASANAYKLHQVSCVYFPCF